MPTACSVPRRRRNAGTGTGTAQQQGALLPPSYKMATGPRPCTGFAVAWARRNAYDTILTKHHPALSDVVKRLRPLRLKRKLNPKAVKFSPTQSTTGETRPKGRFDSLPFSNGAAFKSIDEKDARVLGMKGGTPWKSTSSQGKSSSASSAELKKKLKFTANFFPS